ncbi:MAG: hypothetical protein KAQ62_22660 [Cyclobacteriaceae bacterium]|nr:hypothetical protein [Cyclobacteriaceae bacterium]
MVLIKFSLSISLLFLTICSDNQETSFNKLYPILNEYVKNFPKEFRKIPEDRRYILNEIIYFLEDQEEKNAPWQLIFISTNQSSVDQMAQVWSKVAAFYFGFPNLESFSGGIKPNEISVNTIVTLEKAGFIVYKTDIDGIDVYRVKYSYNQKPIVAFPKKTEHVKNPDNNFMAVFVGKNADINTQNIKGTYNRLLLNYDDPVGYEGSGLEDQIYAESCKKVAVEMFYVFSQLRKRLKDN